MCGVTGWVAYDRNLLVERAVLDAMVATMACRGPDAEGAWMSSEAALGHRRLAVIDLVGGSQPMQAGRSGAGAGSPTEAVLTYSGELYNYRELRDEMVRSGDSFRTDSDTEVVLRAYLRWGVECFRRFNGIFGLAIWDRRSRRLILARDPLGVKPLYYARVGDGVVFGSEPKALLAHPEVPAELDQDGLAQLFAMFGTHHPGPTPLRGIHEVPAGAMAIVQPGRVTLEHHWQLTSREHTDDETTTVATVRDLLTDTVRRQLVADVPLCSLVSGGLDSSAVTALAAAAAGDRRVRTFSVDFQNSEKDFVPSAVRPELDAPYVSQLVTALGTDHTDVVLGVPDLLGAQQRATRARDLPSLGDLDASLLLLFEAIQGRSTVALSGESADEVFGGYGWFHDERAIRRDTFPWAPPGAGLGDVLAPDLQRSVRPRDFLADSYRSALREVPALAGESTLEHRRREVNYLALKRFLPVLLDRKDRMSMAVGLEVRVPFCDHRLVEYLFNVPWAMKCADGVPKGLLRRAVHGLLPASLVNRRKSIYPGASDPHYDATLRAGVRDLLKADSATAALLDPERVMAIVDATTAKPLWQQRMAMAYLLQVDYWLNHYGVRILAGG